MRAGEVSQALAAQADSVAAYLLPDGKRQGREWLAGDARGGDGESLKVCISGSKAGIWSDFATGESGDLIDLWAANRGVDLRTAIAEAKQWLGITEQRIENRRTYSKPSREGVKRVPPQVAEWLTATRKISPATIEAFKLAFAKGALMFPYLRDGELVAAKYRRVPSKEFFVDADCEPCLFGWQAFADARSCVLVEGEMDALALREYGVQALSVPFGGGKAGKQAPWIDAEFDRLALFDTIHLALDNDAEGQSATHEIVARLGRERCRVVTFPHKDANECLVQGVSRETILQCIANARTLDPEQLRSASDYGDSLEREFAVAAEPELGIRLPWPKVEDKLVLREGELSIWAGFNGHGKSEMIGNVTIGALRDGWTACVASMEFKPVKWLKRLVRQATGQACPSTAYVRHVSQWFRDKLWVFDATGTAKANTILEVFKYAARRYGVKLFVIDNLAKCGFGEDDYNGQKQFVDQLTDFAKEFDCHVALVCHMRKTDAEEKPGGKMDIKGTGGITDMADTVMSVWRNKPKEKAVREGSDDPEVLRKPDAILACHKQRNGEHEPTVYLWFNVASHQFLQNKDHKPRPYVGFSVMQDEGVPM